MNRRILSVIALSSCLLGASLQAGVVENLINAFWKKEEAAPATMKILVIHDKPGAVLEVKGKYKIYDPHTNEYLSTRFIGKRKFIQALNSSLKWGEEFPGVHQLKIVPDDPSTTSLVDGVEYKGDLYIYDIGGTISIVNEIPLDDYLRIVLNPLFDNAFPEEVAAAIAIAARGNAWYQVQNPKSDYFTVDAGKIGYRGFVAGAKRDGIDTAITDTKNMILTKNNEAFPNNFTGTTQTTNPQNSEISLEQAIKLAQKGDHAAEILQKAYPGSKVSLINQ